eukprot:747705-Hanusia_phi.AAC.5
MRGELGVRPRECGSVERSCHKSGNGMKTTGRKREKQQHKPCLFKYSLSLLPACPIALIPTVRIAN